MRLLSGFGEYYRHVWLSSTRHNSSLAERRKWDDRFARRMLDEPWQLRWESKQALYISMFMTKRVSGEM
jgi:hypothetical protein